MLHEVAMDADTEAEAILDAYRMLVQETIETVGIERVTAETSIDRKRLDGASDDDLATLSIQEAATILALEGDRDPEAIVYELRDHLLMGMTTAVLDVDTIAGAIDADLTGQEVQQALEGRAPMTLEQLSEIQAVIETRKR
ncbi:DUF5791 family protein [Halopenitus sp. H-Gu1]|uniref:DUF5791 family protein n=1 Tax=Halopenitus sp. H-Gu1 TaxID=3242697 RepID=UPI00359DFB61